MLRRRHDDGATAPMRHTWLPLMVGAWVVAPLVLVAGLTWVSWQQTVRGPTQALWTAATDAGSHADRRVELALSWASPVRVAAPEWSGLVREVYVSSGDMLASGSLVARVDEASRLAWHAPAPFYRPLALKDTGDDVLALHDLLRQRGLEAGGGDVFTAQTKRAVLEFGRQLGITDNSGVFDPALIVHLPVPAVLVTEVLLQVGEPAPAQGSPLVNTARSVTSALLTAPGTVSASGTQPENEWSTPITSIVANDDEILIVGGTEMTLTESRDRLDEASVATLAAALVSGQDFVVAQLRRPLPGGSVRIPSAAVHTAPDGTTCVATGRPDAPAALAVSIIGGLAGETVVTGSVKAGELIAIGVLMPGALCD